MWPTAILCHPKWFRGKYLHSCFWHSVSAILNLCLQSFTWDAFPHSQSSSVLLAVSNNPTWISCYIFQKCFLSSIHACMYFFCEINVWVLSLYIFFLVPNYHSSSVIFYLLTNHVHPTADDIDRKKSCLDFLIARHETVKDKFSSGLFVLAEFVLTARTRRWRSLKNA